MATEKSGALLKHSTIYAVGTIARQLASFVMLPVYTNYLTPADYGVVGLLVFTLALLEPLLGARLSEAMPKFYYEQDEPVKRAAVVTTAMLVTASVSAIVSIVIFSLRSVESTLLFGTDAFQVTVGIFGFQILTQAIEYYGLTFIRMQQRPITYVWISLSKLVVQLTLNIWFVVFLKMGVLGVVLGGGLSSLVYAIALAIYVVVYNGLSFDILLARRMLSFNMPLWFSGLAALYIFSANRYYIRAFSSLEEVGLYELAARFAGVLPLLVWTPFAQYWEMERFRRYRQGVASAEFGQVFKMVSAVLVIAALGISTFAAPVIQVMSAEGFHGASGTVPILTLAMLFSSLSNFCSFSFLVTERTGVINRISYTTVVAISVLNLALIPAFGQMGAATALLCSLATQFLLIYTQSRRFYDMHIALKPLFAMIAVAIGGYLCTAVAVSQQKSLLVGLAIRTMLCAVTCVAIGALLWRDDFARIHMRKAIAMCKGLLGVRATSS